MELKTSSFDAPSFAPAHNSGSRFWSSKRISVLACVSLKHIQGTLLPESVVVSPKDTQVVSKSTADSVWLSHNYDLAEWTWKVVGIRLCKVDFRRFLTFPNWTSRASPLLFGSKTRLAASATLSSDTIHLQRMVVLVAACKTPQRRHWCRNAWWARPLERDKTAEKLSLR